MLFFVNSKETIKLTLWLTKFLMIALLAALASTNVLWELSPQARSTASIPICAQNAALVQMSALRAQSPKTSKSHWEVLIHFRYKGGAL